MSDKKAFGIILIAITLIILINNRNFSNLRGREISAIPLLPSVDLSEITEKITPPQKESLPEFIEFNSIDGVLSFVYPSRWTKISLTNNENFPFETIFSAYYFPSPINYNSVFFLGAIKTKDQKKEDIIAITKTGDVEIMEENSCGENCVIIISRYSDEGNFLKAKEKIISHKENQYVVIIFGNENRWNEYEEEIDGIIDSIQINY